MKRHLVLAGLIAVLLTITITGYFISFKPGKDALNRKANFIVGLVSTTTDDEWSDELQEVVQSSILAVGGEIISIPTLRTQEAQINSLRSLIVYQVDIIIFSPIIETGWDSVCGEAESAGIPIISLAKAVKLSSEKSNVNYVGYDYYQAAAELTQQLFSRHNRDIVLVELFGTLQADSSKRISRGFRDTLYDVGYISSPYTVCCDFMRSRAFQAVDSFLSAGREMDVIVSQGDAMTLGAISALEQNGIKPGEDVMIFAIGGSRESVRLAESGIINCLVQCELEKIGDLTVQAIQLLLDDNKREPITFLADTVIISK